MMIRIALSRWTCPLLAIGMAAGSVTHAAQRTNAAPPPHGDTYENEIVARALAQAQSQEEAATENDVPDVTEIEAWRDRYRRLTVPVHIGGQGPYRFLVDTGAQATVVTGSVSERLALPFIGRSLVVATGSSKIVDLVELDALEFADRRVNNLSSPILEREHVGADGILGLDSLQDLRVLVDFREDRISVTDAPLETGGNPYEIVVRARSRNNQMIITDARIDGIKTAVMIDTGASRSIGNAALERRLRKRASETLSETDVHGVNYSGFTKLAGKLRIGQFELRSVPIGFVDSPAFAALSLEDRPALILGIASLRMFDRIAIDFSTRRVFFDLPDSVMTASDLRPRNYPGMIGQP
ncbi:hypothetical protein GRI38_00360 [Altererythrobacter aurantiacus]|uniref:Aspartyl protease n=1 Tax=Parapontixanthobacter aurantiacus TaxID=1463599 RepID=A0A844ZC48_9SPHN|nr:retroviral-like aspartic protease family protein [Parapontixanthobacter aurantiacus]MXO84490.1 hypothetical protein [Parapontixanthobacter aurantiacus]